MYNRYYRRNKYTGGSTRQTRALRSLRAKNRKAEKTKNVLKVLLAISLAGVLALGGWLIYDHIQDSKAVPPTQIEQPADDTMLEGGAGANGSDSILDDNGTTTPESGDEGSTAEPDSTTTGDEPETSE